jgi:hypothetical protein
MLLRVAPDLTTGSRELPLWADFVEKPVFLRRR